ncbi:DUF4870 domain-containing protein [Tengunoibacter tsumagoiensis]|uniref:DUF4870 domain-containing protein n=1 Tax=Tengunoibacter tsumagoiensis TaxID=2014871 RepID=A0A402A3R8_9CHLR|nr:hypothetical protein [Tengunoibacter tsumagoiensis]GCE13641.1 hypothetical protein KTT_35000 [Tengunoibacter tsumagoiensis]
MQSFQSNDHSQHQTREHHQAYEQQWYAQQQGYGPVGAASQQGPAPQQPYYVAIPYPYASPNSGPGAESKLLAGVSYLGFWLTGLVLLLFVRENTFVRFHALQSTLFFGAINIYYIVFAFLLHNHVPFLIGFPAGLVFVLINIVGVIGWFVGFIGALAGKQSKLPFVGDRAQRMAQNPMATVK